MPRSWSGALATPPAEIHERGLDRELTPNAPLFPLRLPHRTVNTTDIPYSGGSAAACPPTVPDRVGAVVPLRVLAAKAAAQVAGQAQLVVDKVAGSSSRRGMREARRSLCLRLAWERSPTAPVAA
ncbi:hypothetical protein GCM10009660_19320 [Catellatospora bangladeshensis]